MLRLRQAQVIELRDLLRVAIDAEDDFDDLIMRLGRNTADFASKSDSYPQKIKKALNQANAGLWWRDLLREACNAVPADPKLRAFANEVGLAAQVVDGGSAGSPMNNRALELKIKASQSTFDILTWREKMAAIESRVCRIEFPEKVAQGTGFLVGPKIVMTNYHVIEAIQNGRVAADRVVLRFDYKVLANGVAVGAGRTCGLSAKWLAEWSPYSMLDFEDAPGLEPSAEELDFALLNLAEPVGEDVSDEGSKRMGTASDCPVSVRALTYISAGHVIHHIGVVKDRYLTAL